jgi:hypothetical protein
MFSALLSLAVETADSLPFRILQSGYLNHLYIPPSSSELFFGSCEVRISKKTFSARDGFGPALYQTYPSGDALPYSGESDRRSAPNVWHNENGWIPNSFMACILRRILRVAMWLTAVQLEEKRALGNIEYLRGRGRSITYHTRDGTDIFATSWVSYITGFTPYARKVPACNAGSFITKNFSLVRNQLSRRGH